jgi:cytoskeleton protein RodZ
MIISNEMTLSFGQYLQSCRKTKNMEIEAIASELKIGRGVLRAIEEEDLSKLPDTVFAKGFLRGFAKMVGADEGSVIDDYLHRLDQSRQTAPREGGQPVSAKKISINRLTLLTGALLLVICLAVVLGLSGQDNPSPRQQTMAPADSAPAAVQTEAADVPEAEVSAAPEEIKPQTIRLSVVTVADTWLKIIVDNAKAREYLLRPGDNLDLEASSGYNLLIGNAAGVKLFANTVPVDVPGGRGKVVNIQIP